MRAEVNLKVDGAMAGNKRVAKPKKLERKRNANGQKNIGI
jgi:hypothetical protein